MALVSMGGGITNIKGKIAGNYFQKSSTGTHLKACPRRVTNQKTSIKNTHKIFSTVQNAWRSKVWTVAELNSWKAYLKRHPNNNAFGEMIVLTPQLGFLAYNLIRVRNNLSISFAPPREIV